MSIVPGQGWQEVVERIEKGSRVTILLGETDSGKSTFCRYLLQETLSTGLAVAVVDSDIGQSSLFLPTTISMRVFTGLPIPQDRNPDGIFFVGFLNPVLDPDLVVKGAELMLNRALSRGAERILVDTTGLVRGALGRQLKLKKVSVLRPSLVVALQRSDELEHILSAIPEDRVMRIRVSEAVRVRDREERIRYRNRLFKEYFRDAFLTEIDPTRVELLYHATKYNIRERYIRRGTLLGLQRWRETVAIGIFDSFRGRGLTIVTPAEIEGLERVIVGDTVVPEEVWED